MERLKPYISVIWWNRNQQIHK